MHSTAKNDWEYKVHVFCDDLKPKRCLCYCYLRVQICQTLPMPFEQPEIQRLAPSANRNIFNGL